jgi:hypothetical protein
MKSVALPHANAPGRCDCPCIRLCLLENLIDQALGGRQEVQAA